MRREGVKRMVFGSILAFLIAPGIFVAALVLGITNAVGEFMDADSVGPGESVSLQAGTKMSIFVYSDAAPSESGNADTDTTVLPSQECSVTSPGGQPVALTRDTGADFSSNGDEWSQAYSFTPQTTGDYTVNCGDQSAMVLESGALDGAMRSVGTALVVAFVVPFVIGVLGLGLLIWGIVRYNKTKPAHGGYQPPAGYGGGPGQPGYGQQTPYQQPGQQSYGQPGQYGQQPQPGQTDNPYAPPQNGGQTYGWDERDR